MVLRMERKKAHPIAKVLLFLLNPSIKYDIENVIIDTNGRYIIIHLKVAGSHYRIVNLYAPNNEYERVRFMNNMTAILSDDNDKYTETVIGGDFNCVLDSDIDRKNCTASHDVGQQIYQVYDGLPRVRRYMAETLS